MTNPGGLAGKRWGSGQAGDGGCYSLLELTRDLISFNVHLRNQRVDEEAFPAVIREGVGHVFLMESLGCGISSQAATLEGAEVDAGQESHCRSRSLAKWIHEIHLWSCWGNAWGSCRNKVCPLMTSLVSVDRAHCFLMTPLGLGKDQAHWWLGASIRYDGFCSLVLCFFHIWILESISVRSLLIPGSASKTKPYR